MHDATRGIFPINCSGPTDRFFFESPGVAGSGGEVYVNNYTIGQGNGGGAGAPPPPQLRRSESTATAQAGRGGT